jgi:putative transposase
MVRQCELLGLSCSSVYYTASSVSESDLALMRRIDELHLKHPFAGARMLRDLLGLESVKVGRRHVSTLVKMMGIEALYRRPNTSRKYLENPIFPYLLRDLDITRANQVWVMDITYIPMRKGFVYLAAGDFQHRPREPVHQSGIRRPDPRSRHPGQQGWQGSLGRQCVCRAALEKREIRRSLPACLRHGFSGTTRLGKLFHGLQ